MQGFFFQGWHKKWKHPARYPTVEGYPPNFVWDQPPLARNMDRSENLTRAHTVDVAEGELATTEESEADAPITSLEKASVWLDYVCERLPLINFAYVLARHLLWPHCLTRTEHRTKPTAPRVRMRWDAMSLVFVEPCVTGNLLIGTGYSSSISAVFVPGTFHWLRRIPWTSTISLALLT
jgi:hypothetical protein